MDPKLIEKMCSQIYRQFPEVKGKKPKVKPYTASKHLLIFSAKANTADGKTITRTIRVIVDDNGTIGKITTSR